MPTTLPHIDYKALTMAARYYYKVKTGNLERCIDGQWTILRKAIPKDRHHFREVT